ncbi:DMT family transporter [Pelagibacteraceae bacterium]|jgi:drug/metabolite transporter (DMT)-like permease|nr:DMT family transporter [Pelagibacteraceae bacterium]
MNWILITIFAAFFQNLRSSLQKNLNKEISLVASTYVRFVFCLPFAAILYFSYFQNFEIVLFTIQQDDFLFYIFLAAISQIFFTFLLLYSFQFSNFMIGTTLSKTEVVQIAVLEIIILHDKFNYWTIVGIVVSTIGVFIFSTKDRNAIFKNLLSKSTLVGLACGFLLALSVVAFRAASLSLGDLKSNFEMALSTLFFGVSIQTFILTIYISLFEKEQFKKMYQNKKQCIATGFCGFITTLSWFYVFTLMQAAIVRAVGQIELLFSYIASRYYFKEKIKLIEVIGILVFAIGVGVILVAK